MSNLPFVLRDAQSLAPTAEVSGRDFLASEDPLPAVLEINADGFAIARKTRFTEVHSETTDDN